RRNQLTRQCLDVSAQYDDLDLLVIQTRSPLAARDLPLMQQLPYAWLSVTIETDDQSYLTRRKGGPSLARRWDLVAADRSCGILTQLTVSPCLPYTEVQAFGQRLLQSGAHRLVVDSVTAGDGTAGARTARSPFAQVEAGWRDTTHVSCLYEYLGERAGAAGVSLGWSTSGFCGIPPHKDLK